jgi:hypothetical protein
VASPRAAEGSRTSKWQLYREVNRVRNLLFLRVSAGYLLHPSNKKQLSSELGLQPKIISMSVKVASMGFFSALSTIASSFAIAKLDPRDLYVDTKATFQDIVYAATSIVSGQTCVVIKDGTLTVTANVELGWTLDDVHVLVGTAKSTLDTPGKSPYGTHKGSCTILGLQTSCNIPVQAAWRACDDSLYIAVHVAATTPMGANETGWVKSACDDKKGNRAKYWTFTTSCSCLIVVSMMSCLGVKQSTRAVGCLRQLLLKPQMRPER